MGRERETHNNERERGKERVREGKAQKQRDNLRDRREGERV